MFEEFFESPSPADYAKRLINTKNIDENKENVEDIEYRLSNLEDEIKKMSKKEKKDNNADETLKIIRKIVDYNKEAQKLFHRASKVDKRKSKPKIEESIAVRVKLKNERTAEIKEEEKYINNELFKYYFINYQKSSDMYKKLHKTKSEKNENQVYSIKEVLNKMKEAIKIVPNDEENKKIINIFQRIPYLNQLDQSGKGLKLLTPNQMLSRLPITLAQLKAGNNSEKLKNEIRQLLYSLYRLKKPTKQLYESLIDII